MCHKAGLQCAQIGDGLSIPSNTIQKEGSEAPPSKEVSEAPGRSAEVGKARGRCNRGRSSPGGGMDQ